MKIIINEPLIRRNTRIAQIAMVSGLLILAGGMYISFRMPEQFNLSLVALLLGFILSQIGIYFTNRWGRRPRPDEFLTRALKGLDNKYSIYHYKTPASHLLVGPAGIWILYPRHQRGTITFSNGRWRQKGGNLYLKIFAQENLGRPDLEIMNEVERVQSFLRKTLSTDDIPQVQAALIFTNEQVEINIDKDDETPAATLLLNKLKPFIRKAAKGKPISMEISAEIQQILPEEG